jgi:hypothetical protein
MEEGKRQSRFNCFKKQETEEKIRDVERAAGKVRFDLEFFCINLKQEEISPLIISSYCFLPKFIYHRTIYSDVQFY